MAPKRHIRPFALALLALTLVLPPLTSTLADSLGVELSHHHCADHDGDAVSLDAEEDSAAAHDHGAAEHDPYQCDTCHIAIAALAADLFIILPSGSILPEPLEATALVPLSSPPEFKPPIA